jgi:hypothetical protein
MKANFSLLFYMKKPKFSKKCCLIYLCITLSSSRSDVTTGTLIKISLFGHFPQKILDDYTAINSMWRSNYALAA